MGNFSRRIAPFVDTELRLAREAELAGNAAQGFRHLERAHVLGQSATALHVRVHWRMFTWGLRHRRPGDALGQVLRMIGAATKTAIGLVPEGNTGGSNVSPIKPMPVPDDLAELLRSARA